VSLGLRNYIAFLLAIVLGWLWLRAPAIFGFDGDIHWLSLLGVTALYLCSHFFRMLRLVLLTLDERDKAFPLIAAHTLTAFPSSFLPFKIGEVLRLVAFFHVFERRQKALAVWLAERFGDVLVITVFILALYLFNIGVPPAMRAIFVIFVLVSAVGLLGMFAVAKVFVYLNRHLVLASHTDRGLKLLQASHVLRRLELDIYKSVEGRLSGIVLLSILIWVLEILALFLFINHLAIGDPDLAALFAAGLLSSLPAAGAGAAIFGLYQTLALVVLTLVFLLAILLAPRFKLRRT
jgi:hypothetical protein